MSSITVNRGLQRIGVQASQATAVSGPTYGAARHIQTMSVDDSAVAFDAADTALNTGGAVTNEFDAAFDAQPTRAAGTQTVSHTMTIPQGSGNFTIRRIAFHDDTPGNVSTSSTTLVAGIDGQSITKTAAFSLALIVSLAYTNVP